VAHRALAAVDAADPGDSYLALRASLCARREDLPAFDAAFAACFPGAIQPPQPPQPQVGAAGAALPRVALPAGKRLDGARFEIEAVPAAWSDAELLRDRDIATYSASERALAKALVRRLARRGPWRRARRTRPVRRRADRPDLARTVRRAIRHGGEPLERRWRRYGERVRPLVLICDVSGSMEPYSRLLVDFAHATSCARPRVEVFAFGTRLTRLTRQLATRDPDRALERVGRSIPDWSGGTRIGESLRRLNREYGRRLGRGAVVVILSDGWDRGEPELLSAEMARLRLCSHRVVWLNPLKAHPDYAPLTRGMAAALPHTDHFMAGHSLRTLEQLASLLERGLE
jgi:hypothetical protein